MQLVLSTAPLSEPVSVDELALHLRIDEYDSDLGIEIGQHIETARQHVEDITSRKLFTQTWDYYFSAFPQANYFKLPFGNLQSVTHVKYTESNGDQTTMIVDEEYLVETNGDQCGRIVLPYAKSWPSFTAYPSNPIVVRFVCGWTLVASIPEKIKSAIKLICGDLYTNREGQVTSGQDYRENRTVINLLYSSVLRDTFL